MTSTIDLSDVLFSDLVKASDGEPSGNSIGGARREETCEGASVTGEWLEEIVKVEENDDTGSGAGVGDGDFPNDSVRRSKLSTVKRQSGVASSMVSATLDKSTPVFKVTKSPVVDTFRSHFHALLVASVLIEYLLTNQSLSWE